MGVRSPKPVEPGKEYIVDIIGTGKSGDGVARVQDFVISVINAKAGDKNVKIKINSVGDRFAFAYAHAVQMVIDAFRERIKNASENDDYGTEHMPKGIIFQYEEMADRLEHYMAKESLERSITSDWEYLPSLTKSQHVDITIMSSN